MRLDGLWNRHLARATPGFGACQQPRGMPRGLFDGYFHVANFRPGSARRPRQAPGGRHFAMPLPAHAPRAQPIEARMPASVGGPLS